MVCGVNKGAVGVGVHSMVVAEPGQNTSCLPDSCTPIESTPFGYNVLKIVELTSIGPQAVVDVTAVPIASPSKYKFMVVVLNAHVTLPEIDGALADTGPIIVPHLLAKVAPIAV